MHPSTRFRLRPLILVLAALLLAACPPGADQGGPDFSLALDISELPPLGAIDPALASSRGTARVEGIDRILVCLAKDGVHLFRNESIPVEKADGRLVSDVLHLKRGEVELAMLVLVDDTLGASYLVRTRDRGSVKIMMDGDRTVRLSKDDFIVMMDTEGIHAQPALHGDPSHAAHAAHSGGCCDGKPWCLYPDGGDPVVPPEYRPFLLEVRKPNPDYDPEAEDPVDQSTWAFIRTGAFYRLRKGRTILASGVLGSEISAVPWDGTGRHLNLMVEKEGFAPRMVWIDAVSDSGGLVSNGMVEYLAPHLAAAFPYCISLFPDSLVAASVSWDAEAFSASETWELHILDADGSAVGAAVPLDLSSAGNAAFPALESGQSVCLSGPSGALPAKVKLQFWTADRQAVLGTWVLVPRPDEASGPGTASFKDEGALPDYGYDEPRQYPAFFLADKADFLTGGTVRGIIFEQAGGELFPLPIGWE